MKLLMVLMLAALPLLCYTGSGCQLMDEVVEKTIDSKVSISVYKELLKEYINSRTMSDAVGELKQYFLNQSDETLKNFRVMMETMYDSI
ncbi:mammaglobin-B-like [Carlito syrichta]|uniref:Mammaglobin-B-like n=1 Tax=Carlito syrichta TaxID=1868482 RepID=A0A3Q0DSV9_CARSF|nr:mammaglobin-B-like [Carlito syrichta]